MALWERHKGSTKWGKCYGGSQQGPETEPTGVREFSIRCGQERCFLGQHTKKALPTYREYRRILISVLGKRTNNMQKLSPAVWRACGLSEELRGSQHSGSRASQWQAIIETGRRQMMQGSAGPWSALWSYSMVLTQWKPAEFPVFQGGK